MSAHRCPPITPSRSRRRGVARLFWFALCSTLLLPGQAWSWNGAGHRLTAAIAWSKLTPAARQSVGALLAAHPAYATWRKITGDNPRATFIESAAWPDNERNMRQPAASDAEEAALGSRRKWHYVNFPLAGDADASAKALGGALHRALPVLERRLGDQQKSATARADALVWLVHLVGDAHQPLHTVSRADANNPQHHDAGGNRLPVLRPGQTRSTGNLHAYWDRLPGSNTLRGSQLDQRAQRLATRTPISDTATDSAGWIAESVALARAGVYPADDRPPALLTPAYQAWAKARADEQIARAGHRLAALLNRLLPAD